MEFALMHEHRRPLTGFFIGFVFAFIVRRALYGRSTGSRQISSRSPFELGIGLPADLQPKYLVGSSIVGQPFELFEIQTLNGPGNGQGDDQVQRMEILNLRI